MYAKIVMENYDVFFFLWKQIMKKCSKCCKNYAKSPQIQQIMQNILKNARELKKNNKYLEKIMQILLYYAECIKLLWQCESARIIFLSDHF